MTCQFTVFLSFFQLQQQRLFAIQQQHQGPDKAAIEQTLAAQAAQTAQAIQQQQQLMQKMMQNMNLFNQQQQNASVDQEPISASGWNGTVQHIGYV